MGTNRFERCKPKRRPKKTPAEKRRREKIQRDRLSGLGMDEDAVKKMNAKDVRTALRHPAKVKQTTAA